MRIFDNTYCRFSYQIAYDNHPIILLAEFCFEPFTIGKENVAFWLLQAFDFDCPFGSVLNTKVEATR